MRTLIILLICTLLPTFSLGQTDSTKYYFEEIRMTIYVPSEFRLQDSIPETVYLDYNLNPIKDTQKLKELTADEPKTLLEIESLDKRNTMSLILTPVTEMFTRTFGDSTQFFDLTEKFTAKRLEQEPHKIEIPFSSIKIHDFNFRKFFYSYTIRGVTHYEGGYIAKIGIYYLSIKLNYEDKILGSKLMSIIETSKFD